ncbi:MAG TPA: hypothetical protein VGM80_01055 [Gaiellaceae bacterium]|jgi:hypothetical protein
MARLALAGVAVGILLATAGCGGQTTYTLARTKTCLTQRGVQVSGKFGDDFVAGTAMGGATVAHLGDNFVTIAFGQDVTGGDNIELAYTRFSGANIKNGLPDVLRRYNNAVTLWHMHPSDSDLALIVGCLR